MSLLIYLCFSFMFSVKLFAWLIGRFVRGIKVQKGLYNLQTLSLSNV